MRCNINWELSVRWKKSSKVAIECDLRGVPAQNVQCCAICHVEDWNIKKGDTFWENNRELSQGRGLVSAVDLDHIGQVLIACHDCWLNNLTSRVYVNSTEGHRHWHDGLGWDKVGGYCGSSAFIDLGCEGSVAAVWLAVDQDICKCESEGSIDVWLVALSVERLSDLHLVP
jgi:hypothetical protein